MMDFRTFSNLVLSVAIILGFLFLRAWTDALMDCGRTCLECRELQEFHEKLFSEGPIEPSLPGYSTSIMLEINVSQEVRDIMSCQKNKFTDMAEYMECQRIAPTMPA